MSELNFQIGQRVELSGRNLKGCISFIGLTSFSAGKWIGVELDDERGKNNGTVKGCCYFKCAPNHGIFVRPTQLRALEPGSMDPGVSEGGASATSANSMLNGASTSSSSSSTNLLKTTKICAPKEAKQFLSSSSQLSLHVAPSLVATMAVRSATSAVLSLPPKRSNVRESSPTEQYCCAKRSSFVETGFLEILLPQFTPGEPLHSPTVNATAANKSRESQAELQELQLKFNKLEHELEELLQQRKEDKRKLYELDKVKLNNDKLLEFKVKIMEQHGALQRELQRSRQESRDSNDEKGRLMRELTDLSESLELLTLDKEMAEERAETLQIELEIANERNQELTLDVEILRAEYEGGLQTEHQGKDEVKPNVGQLRKLEQHNLRLKQTVISLRDVLTQEKHDLQKATKELETKYSEIAELKKTKEILSKRIDIMETQIIDLKEQVDAALGADCMVEMLANSKLELEERVKLLEEEVAELEALEGIHEQIIEGNQDLELDLREEVGQLSRCISTLQQEKQVAYETICERDITIQKFRELVRGLNETITTKETTSLLDDINSLSYCDETPQSLDYNQVFSMTKACGREIDTQLTAIELKLCQMQIDFLLAFMPDDFLSRGSDYDVITLLITLHRLVQKVGIICNTINEKFPSTHELDTETVFDGFSVHRFAFRSKSCFFLHSIKVMLQQIINCIQHSDYQLSLQAAAYRGEFLKHELEIDATIKSLKCGELDENSSTEALECFHLFLCNMHTNMTVEQSSCDFVDEQQLFLALVEIYDMAVDCININAELLQRIISIGEENSESFSLMQTIVQDMSKFKQKLKGMRLKMPLSSVKFSGLQDKQLQRFKATNDAVGRLINILSISTKESLKTISSMKSDESAHKAIEHNRLWQILCLNCAKLSTVTESGPSQVIQNTTELLDEQINEIQQFINEQQNAKLSNINTVYVRTSAHALLKRASQVKEEFEEVKKIMSNLEAREKEIKTLKYIVKMKQTEYSEMQIRKDMTERNLTKLQTEQSSAIMAISRHAETISSQYDLREKLLMTALSIFEEKVSNLDQSLAKQQKVQQLKSTSTCTTLNNVNTDINVLSFCLRQEYKECIKLKANVLKHNLKQLEPISVPQKQLDQTLVTLEEECRRIKNDWILSHIHLKNNSSSAERSKILKKSSKITNTILREYLNRKPYRAAPSDFGSFFSREMRQLWQ